MTSVGNTGYFPGMEWTAGVPAANRGKPVTIRGEVADKMARIGRACGAPATWGELRKDLLAAGATPEEADEHIAEQKAQRNAD